MVCIISDQRNVNVISSYNMSLLLIGSKIKVLMLLFLCIFLYLQEEIELQGYVQLKDGQPVMSNLPPKELDNKRSGTFSADERKGCSLSQNFISVELQY